MKTKRNYKLVQFKRCGDSYINHFDANNKYYKDKIGPVYESDWPGDASEEGRKSGP